MTKSHYYLKSLIFNELYDSKADFTNLPNSLMPSGAGSKRDTLASNIANIIIKYQRKNEITLEELIKLLKKN